MSAKSSKLALSTRERTSLHQNKASQGSIQLSVIFVNYNVKEFLEQSLISLRNALKELTAEIIIVDNASNDGSVDYLRTRFPDVRFIANSQNFGFAKASNQGLRIASGRFRVLLNPDTLVQEDTFRTMLAFMEKHPDTGVAGCKILNPDGSLQLACRRSFPTPWVAFTRLSGLSHIFPRSKLFGRYNLTYLDPDLSCEVEAISGSMMMVRDQVLDEVGYFDESFFMYGEDLDWCYRISQGGWKVRYCSETQIIHFKGESSKRAEFDSLRLFYLAMGKFVKKHFERKYLFMPYWLLSGAVWIRAGFSLVLNVLKKLALHLTDLSFLVLAMSLSVLIRFGDFTNLSSFAPLIAIYCFVWLALLNAVGCHGRRAFSAGRAAGAIFLGFFVNAALLFFFKQFAYSRGWVLWGTMLALIAVPGWRLVLRWLMNHIGPTHSRLRQTIFARNAVVVGELDAGIHLIKKLDSRAAKDYTIRGLVSLNGLEAHGTGVEILGSVSELNRIIDERKIQEVIFATDKLSYDSILELISGSGRKQVAFKLAPGNLDVLIGKASVDRIADLPLVEIDYRLHKRSFRAMKRAFDMALASCLMVPALAVFAWQIFVRGARPKATTVRGAEGVPVSLAFFRPPLCRLVNSAPLLWSILRGKFSFVGAEILEVTDQDAVSPLALVPGLTGLSQLKNRRLSHDERKQIEIYYMKNYSPLLDLEIIFKAVFKSRVEDV